MNIVMKPCCTWLTMVAFLAGVTVLPVTAAIVPARLDRLTTLVGTELQNPKGENLGEIEDVVIDAASGRLVYAVIAFGGFLGLGENRVAMPWRSLQASSPGEPYVLAMSEEQLKNAPSFNPNEWPDMEDRHWGDTIHAYYGVEPHAGQHLPSIETRDNTEPKRVRFWRSSQALRHDVMNTRNQHIGQIEDIVIDTTLGDIAYAVLSFGGFLGLGEKWFAIPWGAFDRSAGFQTLVLDVSEESLEKAPGFNQDNWPEMANPRWASAVHDYFKRPPDDGQRTQQGEVAQRTRDDAKQTAEGRTDDEPKRDVTAQTLENAPAYRGKGAPVTVKNAIGTILALRGPITISCQPDKAVAGDVPAIAQTNQMDAKAKRELYVQQQDGKIEIACGQPDSAR